MELYNVQQSDIFSKEELDYASLIVRLYKLTVQTYVNCGSQWVTPAVIHGTVLNHMGQTTAIFDLNMCRRLLTVMSYNQGLAISPLSVLLDDKTKQVFMLVAMAG